MGVNEFAGGEATTITTALITNLKNILTEKSHLPANFQA